MRTFIAIDIPVEVKDALTALQDDLRQTGADVTWAKPESFHLTLKFLGEIEKKRVSQIEKVCQEVGAGLPTFSLSLRGSGAFPNARHPRVLWAGLTGETARLEKLQERLDEQLASIGFDSEENDYHPHLTIGRVKSNRNAAELITRADRYPIPSLSFVVEEIVLMKSDLDPEGSIYTKLFSAKLGKPEE